MLFGHQPPVSLVDSPGKVVRQGRPHWLLFFFFFFFFPPLQQSLPEETQRNVAARYERWMSEEKERVQQKLDLEQRVFRYHTGSK